MHFNRLLLSVSSSIIIIIIFAKEFVDDDTKDGYFDNLKEVGFKLKMMRVKQPYLLKYYFPCVAIVVVTQISFYIPPDAIPGRIALLVTQFLTLTNLFISEQVRIAVFILVRL